MRLSTWRIKELTGYEPITTFYEDFSIADRFGLKEVKGTYRTGRAVAEALGYKELTEFVMALNWKIHEHYGSNDVLARLYNDLWAEADIYARENLKGEELAYFFETID